MLYLHKQAYLTKVDRDPEFKRLVAELDRRAAGKDEFLLTRVQLEVFFGPKGCQ